MVFADLDMKNFFNTVEWVAIREAVAQHFSEIGPTLDWEQRTEGLSFLADGSSFRCNRGSEQGETLGPIKAALPLIDARQEAWFSGDVQVSYADDTVRRAVGEPQTQDNQGNAKGQAGGSPPTVVVEAGTTGAQAGGSPPYTAIDALEGGVQAGGSPRTLSTP